MFEGIISSPYFATFLALLAFALAESGILSVFLSYVSLVAAGVVAFVGIARALPAKQVLLTAFAVLLFVLVAGYWIHTKSVDQSKPFKIANVIGLINQPPSICHEGEFWVRYSTSYGDTISPIALAMFVEITNLDNTPLPVESFSVSIESARCGSIPLVPIKLQGREIFWTAITGLSHARLLDFTTNGLDYLLQNPIPPKTGVYGWWFFDSVDSSCPVQLGDLVDYQIRVDASDGRHTDFSSETLAATDQMKPLKQQRQGQEHDPTFIVPPRPNIFDLSTAYRKLYSDPIR